MKNEVEFYKKIIQTYLSILKDYQKIVSDKNEQIYKLKKQIIDKPTYTPYVPIVKFDEDFKIPEQQFPMDINTPWRYEDGKINCFIMKEFK